MSDVALDPEGKPFTNPFIGLAPVPETTQGEINRIRIEALNRRIRELTEERDKTEAEERDRAIEFPIYGSDQDKYQYLNKKFSEARDRKDEEGKIFYNGEIRRLLSGDLTNTERRARLNENYRLAKEGMSPASQEYQPEKASSSTPQEYQPEKASSSTPQEYQPEMAPSSTPQEYQPEEESHGVKVFLIIVYVFLIIGTIVTAALYFSYKEEWFLYIILGLLALLFILFIVLFYFSFKNSK
jgi:hypothetical protein